MTEIIMDYLKAFTIGTSGPVWSVHVAQAALADPEYYDYSFKTYSLIAPIYYGLISMLALYLGKTYGWSLRKRLFMTSIISIVFVLLFNWFYSRCHYNPYREFTLRDWLRYLTQHLLRHLVNINLILYFLTEQFDSSFWWKVFIVGSSIFSYFITYLKVQHLDAQGIPNYDYRLFAVNEPYIQGLDLLINVLFFHVYLKYDLKTTLLIWSFLSTFIWLGLATHFQTYKYQGQEWTIPLIRNILTGLVKAVPIHYLLTKL